MAHQVRHDEENRRFVIDLTDGEAVLDYVRVDDHTLDYRSTRVPASHRGEGIAGELVTFALERARERGERVIPGCSYVEHFLEHHPEYSDLVADRD